MSLSPHTAIPITHKYAGERPRAPWLRSPTESWVQLPPAHRCATPRTRNLRGRNQSKASARPTKPSKTPATSSPLTQVRVAKVAEPLEAPSATTHFGSAMAAVQGLDNASMCEVCARLVIQ